MEYNTLIGRFIRNNLQVKGWADAQFEVLQVVLTASSSLSTFSCGHVTGQLAICVP